MSRSKRVLVGQFVVSKIDTQPGTFRCAKQARRLQRLARMGVPTATLVHQGTCGGRSWSVFQRVHGPLRRELSSLTTCQHENLVRMIHFLSSAGIHVGDLHDKNIVWNGTVWVVIDCGSIRKRHPSLVMDALVKRLHP